MLAPATSEIDVSFVEQYNADLHIAFQQMGPRLQSLTRKGRVMGKTVHWQKIGTLSAQDKPRSQPHVFIHPEHDTVKADMVDKYVPTLIDELDTLKQNIDERAAHSQLHVAAIARWQDSQIMGTIVAGAGAELGDAGVAFGYEHAMAIVTRMNNEEVPDDGNRYCALHPNAWAQFIRVPEFANADYVGYDALPFKNRMQAKMWMGMLWMPMPSVVPFNDTTKVATNVAWHRSVVGHGQNKEPSARLSYENTYSAWAMVSSVSQGAAIIEDTGVYTSTSLSPEPTPVAAAT